MDQRHHRCDLGSWGPAAGWGRAAVANATWIHLADLADLVDLANESELVPGSSAELETATYFLIFFE